MKTSLLRPRTVTTLLASCLLAAATFAGPGPQYRERMNSVRSAANSLGQQPVATETVACDGCVTTPLRVINARHPAGKGAARSKTVGVRHACGYCDGVSETRSHQSTDTMTRTASCEAAQCCRQ